MYVFLAESPNFCKVKRAVSDTPAPYLMGIPSARGGHVQAPACLQCCDCSSEAKELDSQISAEMSAFSMEIVKINHGIVILQGAKTATQ